MYAHASTSERAGDLFAERLQKPAVATPALCEVRPTVTPASAAADQGVRVLSGEGGAVVAAAASTVSSASGLMARPGTAICVLTSPVTGSGISDGATGSGDRSIATSPPPRERSSSRGNGLHDRVGVSAASRRRTRTRHRRLGLTKWRGHRSGNTRFALRLGGTRRRRRTLYR